uniref:Uncharacterized protein n=1 Tax=Arundo donax TaxID=35708 RepID=A0A0A9FC65_ARUDO
MAMAEAVVQYHVSEVGTQNQE